MKGFMANDPSSGISPKSGVFKDPHQSGSFDSEDWKPIRIFRFIDGTFQPVSCHTSLLRKGNSPHGPHSHEEEEILILLSGKVCLELPDICRPSETREIILNEGQFVYYPAFFPHTLKTESSEPAKYIMFKWKTSLKLQKHSLGYLFIDIFRDVEDLKQDKDFYSLRLFQGPTRYLEKLHCHLSAIKPGRGYHPHSDNYYVAVVVLEGELETLDKKAGRGDIIWYYPGEPHGMKNTGGSDARYIVFEFHTRKTKMAVKAKNLLKYIFNRISDRDFWRRRLKKIAARP
jgi:quercetin dioxygenase-like cupin family protein